MRIRLDRTVCEGFGVCGLRAPETFSLDEWGYASLTDRSGEVPAGHENGVRRAVADCPVRAITEPGGPEEDPPPARGGRARRSPTPSG